jgi:predicted MFS family arabinose efflux permease
VVELFEASLSTVRPVLALAAAVVFVDTVFFTALTPLLPHYAQELELSKAGAGVLQAAYPAGTFAAAIPSGVLASRAGVRAPVLAGLAVIAVTSMTFAFAGSAWLLDSARFVQGVGSSFAWTGALAWLVREAPAERRSQLLGLAMGAAIVGGLLGPVLGAAASLVGTPTAFGCVAGLAVLLALAATRLEPPRRGERQPLRDLFSALRDPTIQVAIWFVFLPGLLFGVLAVLAPLRLSKLGLGAVAIGATFLVSGVLEAALSPTIGRIIDRIGAARPLRAGLVAAAALSAVLPWPTRGWLLASLIALTGLSFGAFWVPGFALLTERAEARGLDYGYGFALMNSAWAPGEGIGAALSGAAAAVTASDAVPYLGLTVVCLASLLALRRVRGPALIASRAET